MLKAADTIQMFAAFYYLKMSIKYWIRVKWCDRDVVELDFASYFGAFALR